MKVSIGWPKIFQGTKIELKFPQEKDKLLLIKIIQSGKKLLINLHLKTHIWNLITKEILK